MIDLTGREVADDEYTSVQDIRKDIESLREELKRIRLELNELREQIVLQRAVVRTQGEERLRTALRMALASLGKVAGWEDVLQAIIDAAGEEV